MEVMTVVEKAQRIIAEVRKVVVGKDNTLVWALAAMLSGGHILMEDIPGVGKTTMALAFSKALGLSYNRVQFNPDVLPSDITGYHVPDKETGKLIYRPGSILCNLFLADELNRATSRTQSALLEAMEEGQVTVDGQSHSLPAPFIVIATQNPTGAAGTQMLPDSQMDRFTVRLQLGYPDPKDEMRMAKDRQGSNPMDTVTCVVSAEELTQMQRLVAETYVADSIIAYVVELIGKTRRSDRLLQGASPRATLAVLAMVKAVAQLRGRDYVVPGDVQEVFVAAVAHRLLLNHVSQSQGISAEEILQDILQAVPAPKIQ